MKAKQIQDVVLDPLTHESVTQFRSLSFDRNGVVRTSASEIEPALAAAGQEIAIPIFIANLENHFVLSLQHGAAKLKVVIGRKELKPHIVITHVAMLPR